MTTKLADDESAATLLTASEFLQRARHAFLRFRDAQYTGSEEMLTDISLLIVPLVFDHHGAGMEAAGLIGKTDCSKSPHLGWPPANVRLCFRSFGK